MTAPGLVSFGDFWGGAEDACPCFLECYPAAALHWVGSKSVYLHRPGDASGRAMKGRSLRALLWTFELVESANARGHQQDDVDVAPPPHTDTRSRDQFAVAPHVSVDGGRKPNERMDVCCNSRPWSIQPGVWPRFQVEECRCLARRGVRGFIEASNRITTAWG